MVASPALVAPQHHAPPQGFLRTHVFSLDHKVIGKQYLDLALVAEREAIQKEIDALKVKKDAVAPARYEQDMERLLTNLALKTKAIRDREAKP